jgi:hypothetical protein
MLLFLAGLEIDPDRLKGRFLTLSLIGFVASLGLGLVLGAGLHAAGAIQNPLFLAITLSATSLGLVVPVLKDAWEVSTSLGQLTIAAPSIADFASVIYGRRCAGRAATPSRVSRGRSRAPPRRGRPGAGTPCPPAPRPIRQGTRPRGPDAGPGAGPAPPASRGGPRKPG